MKSLAVSAKKEFLALGLLEEAVALRKDHSAIFNIKGDDIMFAHLTKNNILCSQRGNGIRFSFHYYNSIEDLEFIVRIIKERL